ncbi:MAG TPA: metal ABC transporter substrate-binding protein [Clostridia bacterium]
MHKNSFKLLLLILITVIILSGCSMGSADLKVSTNNDTLKKFTIVTSFYPMYLSTINITKGVEGIHVVNMTKPQTGCLHDYQLTPEDLKTLEKADAFVVNGAGMEAFLDKAIKQQPSLKLIEASRGINLIKDEKGEPNPHVWVSVSNAIIQVKNIADQLSSIDKSNAAKYKENSLEYIKKLEALRDKMHQTLDGVKNRDIITFHEAFPYMAKEFNLNISAVIEREPGTEPSPKELEATIKIVKESKSKALFAEPQYSLKAAEAIARETGATIYTLDPAVTGDAKPDSYNAYIDIMERNLDSLQKALK